MEVMKLLIAIAFVTLPSAGLALLSHAVDKPSGRGLLERFIYFLVSFTAIFILSALWENRRSKAKHPIKQKLGS